MAQTNFQVRIRLFFNLIRAHHHLGHVKKAVRTDDVPGSLKRIRNYLATAIHPANPNSNTTTLLQGNASHWLQTNLQILEEHYKDSISTTMQDLRQPTDVNNQEAWQVAIGWMDMKFNSIHPDAVNNAAEDLENIGVVINRLPKKRPLTSLESTSHPPRTQTKKLPHPLRPTRPTQTKSPLRPLMSITFPPSWTRPFPPSRKSISIPPNQTKKQPTKPTSERPLLTTKTNQTQHKDSPEEQLTPPTLPEDYLNPHSKPTEHPNWNPTKRQGTHKNLCAGGITGPNQNPVKNSRRKPHDSGHPQTTRPTTTPRTFRPQ